MFEYFKSLFATDTGKDTTVVFAGTFINVLVGGLFFILAPRIIGPESYGLFSVVMATGLMAVNFANFGIDTGILRFVNNQDKDKRDKILKLAVKAYSLIGFLVFLIGQVSAPLLATAIGAPQITGLLRIAFAGVILILLTNFFVAALQTKKQFLQASLVNISSNSARLLILATAAYFFVVDLYFLTVLFFFVTFISVVVGKLFVPFVFLKAKDENIHFKNFFGYNFWIAASLAISAIPFDNYFLVKIAGPIATGLYAAPMKILATTYQFAGGFSRVLASRFSSFDSDKKAKEFALKTSGVVVLIFTALILTSFLAPFIVYLFGEQFDQSVPIFRILAVGMAFFFADTIPVSLILYYFGKSKVAFYITVYHYLIYTFLLLYFIPNLAAVGAALAFTISEIITFTTLVTYVIYKFQGHKQ